MLKVFSLESLSNLRRVHLLCFLMPPAALRRNTEERFSFGATGIGLSADLVLEVKGGQRAFPWIQNQTQRAPDTKLQIGSPTCGIPRAGITQIRNNCSERKQAAARSPGKMGGREGKQEGGWQQGGKEKGAHVQREAQSAQVLSGQRFPQGSDTGNKTSLGGCRCLPRPSQKSSRSFIPRTLPE